MATWIRKGLEGGSGSNPGESVNIPCVYMADGESVTVTGKADTSGLMGKLFVEYLVLS